MAHEVLSRLKSNNEAWRVVGTILQLSRDSNTGFFALSILEECIATRWNILPPEQRAGVKQVMNNWFIRVALVVALVHRRLVFSTLRTWRLRRAPTRLWRMPSTLSQKSIKRLFRQAVRVMFFCECQRVSR